MGMNISRYKFLSIISLALLANPAFAAVPPLEPLNLKGEYTIAFNGIQIGRIKLTAKEDKFGYSMIVDTKTSGIAKMFSDEKTLATAEGHIGEITPYVPTKFESRPQKDSKGAHTTITYDPTGKMLTRERVPDDDPSWRAPVTADDAYGATDPVTAAFILRRQMHDNMARDVRESTVRTYDGARLADMKFRVVSPARVEIMDKYTDAINTVVTRSPIKGYTPKELKKFKAGDPPVHLYFSADGKMWPVRATVSLMFGEVSATLTKVKE